MVKLLLGRGVEVKAVNNDGWTVLHSAVLNGRHNKKVLNCLTICLHGISTGAYS